MSLQVGATSMTRYLINITTSAAATHLACVAVLTKGNPAAAVHNRALTDRCTH